MPNVKLRACILFLSVAWVILLIYLCNMEMDIYRTIEKPSQDSFSEKRSRFLAFAEPARTIDDVKSIVTRYKQQYYDARHVCYAYMLGAHSDIYAAKDDGEPSGSAGRPILEQIRSFNVTNIVVLVVRYFGGIKLGTGGLFSAYKIAAQGALANADIKEETIQERWELKFEYPRLNEVLRLIRNMGGNILEQEYMTECRIVLSIRQSVAPAVIKGLENLRFVRIKQICESA